MNQYQSEYPKTNYKKIRDGMAIVSFVLCMNLLAENIVFLCFSIINKQVEGFVAATFSLVGSLVLFWVTLILGCLSVKHTSTKKLKQMAICGIVFSFINIIISVANYVIGVIIISKA